MTPQNTFPHQPLHRAAMGKRLLQGAGIVFFLILMYLFSAGAPDPAWLKLWMLKPLVMVPVAGALGGVYYYSMGHLLAQGSWKKIGAIILGLIGYIIILWLGTVPGLNGTM